MQWQKAALLFALTLCIVATQSPPGGNLVGASSQVVEAGSGSGGASMRKRDKVKKLVTKLKGIFSRSKEKNAAYTKGSCWRKAKFMAVDKPCEVGFTKRFGSICTANCPLETPVKCGPTCLPQGRSCAHEAVKKTTVAGLFLAKVFGVGFVGADELCEVLQAGFSDRDVTTRRLETCSEYLREIGALTPSEFAELVDEMFPKTKKRLIRQLVPKTTIVGDRDPEEGDTTAECGMGLFQAISALVNAYKKAKDSGDAKSAEALLADSEAANKVGQAILICVNAGGDHKDKIGGGLEAVVSGIIGYYKEGKSAKQVAEEVNLKLLTALDPWSAVAFAHEFVQDFCKSATLPGVNFKIVVNPMDKTPAKLGLQGKGVFGAASSGSWDPDGKTKDLSITVANNMPFTVKLKLYSGGRRFRDKATRSKVTKRLETKPDQVGVLTVPLDEVRDRTLYIDAMLDKSEWAGLGKGLQNIAKEAITKASFGLAADKFKFEGESQKLGSLVFWVPGESSGYTSNNGTLIVRGEMKYATTP